MDDESGELVEPMEEVPLRQNQRRPEAYLMTQIAYSESQGGGSYEYCL